MTRFRTFLAWMLTPEPTENAASFEDFLKAVEPKLKRLLAIYRIPSDDAEDVLQQALLALLYQWERVRDPESWLFGTVRRHCLMYWRTHRRRIYSAVDSTILEWLSEPIAPSQERTDLLCDLESLIDRLPARCRSVLRLRFRLGYEPPEVARHARLPGLEHRQGHEPVPRRPVAGAAGLRPGGRAPAQRRPRSRRRRAAATSPGAGLWCDGFESCRLFPQTDRLLARIESLDTPLVQLWGWPGSGRTAVLEALLARQGRRAAGAAPGGGGRARQPCGRRSRRRTRWASAGWWRRGGPPGRAAGRGRALAAPGAAAGLRRRDAAEGPGFLPAPWSRLRSCCSTDREVDGLWRLLDRRRALAGGGPRACDAASDGWYRPLRLALEATGGDWGSTADPEALLEIPLRAALPAPRGAGRLCRTRSASSPGRSRRAPARPAAPARRPGGCSTSAVSGSRGRSGTACRASSPPPWSGSAAGGVRVARRRSLPRRRGAGARRLPPSVYFLGLLGSPLARQRDEEGERELDCRLRRSFQVLAFLASSPGLQAGREELIEAVWPTEGERTIERNFHPTLSHLRRALEGGRGKDRPAPLLFRNGVYRLNPEVGWEIDALELTGCGGGEELAEPRRPEAAAETWQRAWKLYRGPFLQGYYEAWVTARREIYQRRYLELLRDLGDLYVRLERTTRPWTPTARPCWRTRSRSGSTSP